MNPSPRQPRNAGGRSFGAGGTTMSPVEVVTDPDAQAALSGAFAPLSIVGEVALAQPSFIPATAMNTAGGSPTFTAVGGTRPRRVASLPDELTSSVDVPYQKRFAGNADITVVVTNLSETAGDVVWAVRYSSLAAGSDLSAAQELIGNGVQIVAAPAQNVVSHFTLTNVPLPAVGNISIERQGANVNDTLAGAIGILGVVVAPLA